LSLAYEVLAVTPFQENCSLVWCEATREGAVIDPGGESGRILARARDLGITVKRVLLTHGHIDHVGAAAEMAATLGATIEGPQREDRFWLDALPRQAEMFGFAHAEPLTPSRWLEHGDRVAVGDEMLEVLHTPGHTPGHVVFYHRGRKLAFVGDVLFQGSIGRTDFPRGDHAALVHSVRQVLFPLGDEVVFVPGHGPDSTFGAERRGNPFVGDGV